MRSRFLLLACVLLTAKAFAQDNMPYADKAAQLQKSIWSTDEPEFKATAVPEKLKNESAVILARSFNSQTTTTGKLNFFASAPNSGAHLAKMNILHERVKINDKAALDEFSQLEYVTKLNNTISPLIPKFADIPNMYVGAKIIKPDGSEVIVNTSEDVLIKNSVKGQPGKLAIPGLQVGDILDYFVGTITLSEKADAELYKDNDKLIFLVDKYPMLYFNINFQFTKKIVVKYITANDSPTFDESNNDAGDLILNLVVKDVPKLKSPLWVAPLRQYPYVEVGSNLTGMFDSQGKKLDQLSPLDRSKALFQNNFIEYQNFDIAEKRVKNFFISNQALKSAPMDSVMKVLYDEWKYLTFFNYTGKELDDVNTMNYRTVNSRAATIVMSEILTDMEIDHDVLMVAARNSNTLDNVYNMTDFDAMIRINGEKPMYMAFDDIVTHFNEVPALFQGERVIAIHGTRKSPTKYIFDDLADDELPVTAASKNSAEESLKVSLLPANMEKLKVDRITKQTGSLRHDNQKLLIPIQDIDKGYTELINGDPLEKRLLHVKDAKKTAEDYTLMFNSGHDIMMKNFAAEIKRTFGQEPEQISNVKIISPALENSSPVFQFSSSFVLNNMVKKAGNNYIIDAGKLTGAFLKLDEKDKTRDKDIYMPSARSFKYNIAITIPAGYEAKGLEQFNQKKTNTTGSFSSVATISGNTLTITVTQVYEHNFEKAINWPKLKDLIQTASDFNDQKIVLQKKG